MSHRVVGKNKGYIQLEGFFTSEYQTVSVSHSATFLCKGPLLHSNSYWK